MASLPAGQAWGAKRYSACGVALQRTLLLALVISAGVALLWTQMEPLLLAIGQVSGTWGLAGEDRVEGWGIWGD